MKKVTEKEIEAVSNLPADERYEYGMKIIADSEELWSLKMKGEWVLAKNEDGVDQFAIWPHPAYAQLCAVGEWKGAVPAKISLDDWFSQLVEKLSDDETGISFFPVPVGKPHEVGLDRFLEDLEREMEQYE